MLKHRTLSSILASAVFFVAMSCALARDAALDQDFRRFLDMDVWPAAKAQGVPRAVFDAALGKVKPDMSLPDLATPGAKNGIAERNDQAEFKSGADYLSARALMANTTAGRAKLKTYAGTLARIEARYGVPAPIIVAVWGRESAFGAAKIPQDAFTVLATKAFLSRRKEMFRTELLAALKIVSDGHLGVAEMRSSTAGALGQPQFMPSKFIEDAVDFDGDGRRDIWSSEPDVLASIGNYLASEGWDRRFGWGFEVDVPSSVSCAREGPDRRQPVADFVKQGVKRASGRPFSAAELKTPVSLLMPAGRFGPGFLVTPNFYTIKAYNNSDLYALFVGIGADLLSGGELPNGGWKPTDRLTRGDVARLQEKLEEKGYDVGGVDGFAGYKTRRSIGEAQAAATLAQSCWPTRQLVETLSSSR